MTKDDLPVVLQREIFTIFKVFFVANISLQQSRGQSCKLLPLAHDTFGSSFLPVFHSLQIVAAFQALVFVDPGDLAPLAVELPVVLGLVPVDKAQVPPLPAAVEQDQPGVGLGKGSRASCSS